MAMEGGGQVRQGGITNQNQPQLAGGFNVRLLVGTKCTPKTLIFLAGMVNISGWQLDLHHQPPMFEWLVMVVFYRLYIGPACG